MNNEIRWSKESKAKANRLVYQITDWSQYFAIPKRLTQNGKSRWQKLDARGEKDRMLIFQEQQTKKRSLEEEGDMVPNKNTKVVSETGASVFLGPAAADMDRNEEVVSGTVSVVLGPGVDRNEDHAADLAVPHPVILFFCFFLVAEHLFAGPFRCQVPPHW